MSSLAAVNLAHVAASPLTTLRAQTLDPPKETAESTSALRLTTRQAAVMQEQATSVRNAVTSELTAASQTAANNVAPKSDDDSALPARRQVANVQPSTSRLIAEAERRLEQAVQQAAQQARLTMEPGDPDPALNGISRSVISFKAHQLVNSSMSMVGGGNAPVPSASSGGASAYQTASNVDKTSPAVPTHPSPDDLVDAIA